ncbi:hypothetical protein MLD38_020113 [Melastoma candidum]|uniref:Uncharacterized protein n=1 Tax=Melastoma candidum TaxID=119954 RepID=A0ACB9QBG3_9MYRT|nr:hypothetical protein MLD38_020113 [Melastoma candidum]
MKRATIVSVAVTTLFYMLCGCFGYTAFGDNSPRNLLTRFGFYNPYWLVDIAYPCHHRQFNTKPRRNGSDVDVAQTRFQPSASQPPRPPSLASSSRTAASSASGPHSPLQIRPPDSRCSSRARSRDGMKGKK